MTGRRPAAAASSWRPVGRFALLCLVYWSIAIAAVSATPRVEEAGIDLTLRTVHGFFALIGQQVSRTGDFLSVGGAGVRVVADCSPHMPWLLFAGVVLAFPASWRQRALGLAFGAATICVFNTVRIASLLGILIWKPAWFEFVHVYLWQTGTVLLVIASFVLWLEIVKRSRPRPSTA